MVRETPEGVRLFTELSLGKRVGVPREGNGPGELPRAASAAGSALPCPCSELIAESGSAREWGGAGAHVSGCGTTRSCGGPRLCPWLGT